MTREVFVDTAYLIAITDPRDELHVTAREATARLLSSPVRLLTTENVLTEFLGYFSPAHGPRQAALITLDELRSDTATYAVLPHRPDDFEQSVALYRRRHDKGYSLVDCHSMLIMRERGIEAILSSDDHFRQAGFTCLLPTGGRSR